MSDTILDGEGYAPFGHDVLRCAFVPEVGAKS